MSQHLEIKISEKKTILASVIGLCLTIASILIYANYKEIRVISIVLVTASLTFGFFQFYIFYFRNTDFGIFGKLFLSFFSCLLFVIIVFALMVILNSYVFSNLILVADDLLMYSVFLLPSFVFVVALLFFLISCMGYT